MDNQLFPKSLVAPVVVSIFLVGMFLSFLKNLDKRNATVMDDIVNERAVLTVTASAAFSVRSSAAF